MISLKLRSWDTENNKMLQVVGIDFGNDANMVISVEEQQGVISNKLLDLLDVMQYTGAIDKNGVEVWSNDIVRDENGNIYTCIFNPLTHTITLTSNRETKHISIKYAKTLEVIGNIYENKELLKTGE